MVAGLDGYLDACLVPEIQRICLLDAPAVLGWQEWSERDARYSISQLTAGIEALIAEREVAAGPVEPLAWVLAGALNEAGRRIARSPDPVTTRADMAGALRRLLEGLRQPQPANQPAQPPLTPRN
jgi:Tetracyclin repressor-like, C-terminal domain